jgi:hypothetical protein
MRAVYGPEADELTIRFPNTPDRDIIVVYIDVPEVDYAALMVHEFTGEVVGVQVDYLADFAVSQHPTWQAALVPTPPPVAVGQIVASIKELHDRFGTESHDPKLEFDWDPVTSSWR